MKHFTFDSLNIPALGLGTWKSPKGEIYQVIRKSIEIGYRHFDCAFIYQNEAEIGQAIADAIKNGDVLREELFITSKLWNNRHQKHLVQPAIEHTLKDLQLDYLDLYLIHWPVAIKNDINFPEKGSDLVSLSEVSLSETWEGMVQIHSQKLAQNVGVSNFSINKIKNIWQEVGVKPAVNQVEAHPFLQQNALLSFAQENDILLTAYAPLGSADRPAARISANEPQLFETETLNLRRNLQRRYPNEA